MHKGRKFLAMTQSIGAAGKVQLIIGRTKIHKFYNKFILLFRLFILKPKIESLHKVDVPNISVCNTG